MFLSCLPSHLLMNIWVVSTSVCEQRCCEPLCLEPDSEWEEGYSQVMQEKFPQPADVMGHSAAASRASYGSSHFQARERDTAVRQLKMTDCEFGSTHMLAQDYLKFVLQIPQPGSGPSKTSRVLQDIAFSVQNQVERSLKPCLDNFDVVSVASARTIFNQVMEKEFEDGVINWGRIVTVFAFEGILIKKLLQQQIAPDVDACKEISYFVAEFLMKNTGEWIRRNGGWENGFVKKFEPKSGWLTFLEIAGKICEIFSLLKQYY